MMKVLRRVYDAIVESRMKEAKSQIAEYKRTGMFKGNQRGL